MTILGIGWQDIGSGGAQAALDAVALHGGFVGALGNRIADTLYIVIIGHGLDDKTVTNPFFAFVLNAQKIGSFFDLNQGRLLVF